jgi:hypothetical protein
MRLSFFDHLETQNLMQWNRRFSVLFDCPDELEWVNLIEIQTRESILWDVILIHVVNMASISPVNVDPQFKIIGEERKSIAIPAVCTWTVVVLEILETSTTALALWKLAVILAYTNVLSVRINDSKVRVPRGRIGAT